MHRLKMIMIGLVVLLAVIGVAGFFIAPPIVKSLMVEKLSEALKRPVSIREIKINPYMLTAAVRGFDIREPSGSEKFASFDDLYVNIDAFSIFKRALILKEIKLTGPYVRIIRNPDAGYNFSDLLVKFAGPEKDSQKKETPFHFSLNNIRIESGSVDFQDGPKKTSHTVRELMLSIPFIANMDYMVDQFAQPVLSANINGNPYLIQGKTKPFQESLETVFDIDIKDFNIPYYLAYAPFDLNCKLLSGAVDIKTQVSYIQSRDKKPSLSIKGDVALKQFAVDDKKGLPVIRIPSLNIAITNIEPLTPLVQLGKVALLSPEIFIRRGKQGDINLSALLATDKKEKAKPDKKQAKADEKASAMLPVDVGEFRIDGGKVTFRDDQPTEPVSLALSNLNLKMTDVSTKKDSRSNLELSMSLGGKGRISAIGPFTVEPFSAGLAMNLNNIDIRPLQGYFTDKVKITVTGGAVTAEGKVGVRDLREKGLSATYAGKFLISNFKSIDKLNAEDFLIWKSLFFSDVRVGYNPLSVNIKRIALADFYAGVVIHENSVMNLQSVFEPETPQDKATPAVSEEKAPGPQKKADAPPATAAAAGPGKVSAGEIKIDAIVLQGGKIDFQDRSIQPNFSANFIEMGGRVSGLTSIGEKPAEVELRGKYNNHMPAEITGQIHPLKEDLFVDMKASFKDMDLSSVSPYSGRYVGHTIQKGKLSFDLKYLIVKGKLGSENKVFIDQLTLGEQVDSPKATKLPVGFAIALLKDRKGQINLDIPVTGSLEDPQFSLGRLIIQVIVNLITKAVTAPFALIGSLVGGGEELGYVEFEYGRAAVSEANLKKIATLTKALFERPALKLDIAGHVDPENDREGLKKAQVERKIKISKFNEMIKQNIAVASVDDVGIAPQEYEKYMRQAYTAEPFPKPRTAVGQVKALPVEEMEKLMLTHVVIKEDDLRMLAARRAAVIRDEFLKSGQVEPDRIFIIEPKSMRPDKKEKLKDSRVEFKLK
ncbi:MAG: hypothetical protein C0394_02935 [Syntrophus sp. (in: bacteria)]|nr:hypothetical protein [Syntrophus sp. (in: bacteria)]